MRTPQQREATRIKRAATIAASKARKLAEEAELDRQAELIAERIRKKSAPRTGYQPPEDSARRNYREWNGFYNQTQGRDGQKFRLQGR